MFHWNPSLLRQTTCGSLQASLQASLPGGDAVRGTENDLQLDWIIVLV